MTSWEHVKIGIHQSLKSWEIRWSKWLKGKAANLPCKKTVLVSKSFVNYSRISFFVVRSCHLCKRVLVLTLPSWQIQALLLSIGKRTQQANCSILESLDLALQWRQGFFDEIHARFEAGKDPKDIDETHRRVFRRLLDRPEWARYAIMSDQEREGCVGAWHSQSGTRSLLQMCAISDS